MTDLLIQEPNLAEVLKAELIAAVREHDEKRPRSQQVAIGASEIGAPCDRQLALKSLGYVGTNRPDPWASIIGTSVHATLAEVFTELGHITEQSVEIAPGIKGTADLFIRDTVIDHKVPADSTMAKVRKGIVSAGYRIQGQCYGYGFAKLGYDVKNIAIAFWPRGVGAWLGGLTVVVEKFQPSIVEKALERWFTIVNAAIELDLENQPERLTLFATADGPCAWCPFHDPYGRAPAPSCKGHNK